jgi:hypothetical protein
VFLSTLRVTAGAMAHRHPKLTPDTDGGRILRSVIMKPEAHGYAGELHARLEGLAAAALDSQAGAGPCG